MRPWTVFISLGKAFFSFPRSVARDSKEDFVIGIGPSTKTAKFENRQSTYHPQSTVISAILPSFCPTSLGRPSTAIRTKLTSAADNSFNRGLNVGDFIASTSSGRTYLEKSSSAFFSFPLPQPNISVLANIRVHGAA